MIRNIILVSLVVMVFTSCQAKKKKENIQPNFLFVLVDDQPYDALGVNERYPFLQTPNMDRLAKEGVLFENYFCTQSICSPSRASFLTGTYAHIHGVNQNNRHVDPDWNRFKPYTQLLQDAGYQTAHVGKIHMAHKKGAEHIRPGFDYWFSFNGQGDYFDPQVNDNGREYQEKGYMTDILTDKAITWLKEKRDKNKPFSLNLWHKAVHEDHSPAPRHDNLYADEKLPEPPHGMLNETFAGKPEWQRIKAADAKWKGYVPVDSLPIKKWPVKGDKFMRLLKTLKAVDESLGKVLATLEELGELENTVIIYSSDNGYFMGEHGYWDKRIAYEASMRIPMLIRYPKLIQPELKINELCLNVDMAPTILELAGVEQPDYMQGESMVELLKHQKDDAWRQSMLFQYYVDDEYPYAGPDMLAVRTDKYKLVDCFLDHDIDELYDLENDPGEMNNLIGMPEYAEVEAQLRQEIERLKVQCNYNPDRDWWLRQVAPKKKKKH
ncbi:sulfatase [Carboxylicivirga mesophila]|uniref:Sulfatase n=1 Tax=Carboxylicivirga mesophila TaxID=1166478 RepID=A0ABS5KDK6_9BACT|nr:sulfatase [Carboxylicivirga mesophila]MBS2213111.1 sulfatase [Carboxylicivirga mesophila]